jgi:pimeloyl-ACP methyl ester carboxylesterase
MRAAKSTNGRSNGAEVPWALRKLARLGGALAPDLAARASVRVFMTPPRHAAPAREGAALAGVERVAFQHAGGTLRGFRIGTGPAVLLVHGWGGRAGQLVALARALADAGCAALAFDAPAHGASSGRLASVPAFADAIATVAAATGTRAAVAHSFGGTALALALARGLPLDAAVLVATPRDPAAYFARFCDALAFSTPLRAAFRARLERRVGISMDALDVPRLAAAARAPLLVVHDRQDAEVPFADGAAVADGWPGARLLATDGLGHRRILRDAGVAGAIVRFVVDRLPRCGCGRLALDGGREPRCAGCAVAEDLWDRGRRRAAVAAR